MNTFRILKLLLPGICLLCNCAVHVMGQQKQLRFHHLTVDDGLPKNSIDCFVQDKYGFIWIATLEGLCRFDGYRVTNYPAVSEKKNTPSNNRPVVLFKDQNEDIWISFSGVSELCRYNYLTDDFTRFPQSNVDQKLQDSLNRVSSSVFRHSTSEEYSWHTYFNVLTQIHRKTGIRMVYASDPRNPGTLFDSFVLAVYRDKTDVLWVGTDNGGVHYADVNQPVILHDFHDPEDVRSIADNTVRALFQDVQGNIWIGTRNSGITRMNRQRNEYVHFRYEAKNPMRGPVNNQIRRICGDSRGYIWVGSKGGLDRYDPNTGIFQHYTTSSASPIPDNWVHAILEDHNGVIWIGTWNGVARYDRERDLFIPLTTPQDIPLKSVRAIVEDRDNNVWIATEIDGLVLLERNLSGMEEFRITHFTHDTDDTTKLSDERIYCLSADQNGLVWVGTGGGLNMFDPSTRRFRRFPGREYIADRFITGILCHANYVWVSHRKGIVRMDTRDYSVRYYDKSDGLQNNEFSEDAYFRNAATGELFFGGSNGFNSFFPDSIRENPYPPEVVLTDLQILNKSVGLNQEVNGRVVLQQPLYLTRELELLFADKVFALEFAALHFADPWKNRYAYKLEGFDQDWVYTDASRRTAVYSNLPAGTYTFMVKASNCDGVWNMTPTLLTVKIRPPWWASVIAYAVYTLILGGVAYGVYRIVCAREKLRHQILTEKWKAEKSAEVEQLKSDFFTRVSHEFRTPLSLIIDPIQTLISERPMPEAAERYHRIIDRNAHRMLQLINQLLDFQKVGSGKQDVKLVVRDVVPFIKNLLSTFDIHAEERHINIDFRCPVPEYYFAFDADKLEKIFVNLVSNAFKYSPDCAGISVLLLPPATTDPNCLSSPDQALVLKICDQGVGIPPEVQDKIFEPFFQVEGTGSRSGNGSGIGLALTRELVTLHGGNIRVESVLGKGTCFVVTLPAAGIHSRIEKLPAPPHTLPQSDNDEEAAENGSSRPMVLLVEDHTDVRKYLKAELSHAFDVVDAVDGEDGWEQALERIPDLVISDVMMPGISGIELCRRLKSDGRTSHIPVILLTAKHSDESRKEGYETGADDYITKPFSSALMATRIRALIESRQKLREYFRIGTPVELKQISVNLADEQFITKAVQYVESHLADTDFTPDLFARELLVSRAQLFRKIKAMTNQTVQEFVTTIKLNKATELLIAGQHSIAEVSLLAGFSEPSNFTRSFVKQFGQTPSSFIKDHKS